MADRKKKTKSGKKASAPKRSAERETTEKPVADKKAEPASAAIDSSEDQIRNQEGSQEGKKEEKAPEKKRSTLAWTETEESTDGFWTDALFFPEERLIRSSSPAPKHIDDPLLHSQVAPSVVAESESHDAAPPPQSLPESAIIHDAAAPSPPAQEFAERQDASPQAPSESKEAAPKGPGSLLNSVAPAPFRLPLPGKDSASRSIAASWFDDETAPAEQESQEPTKSLDSPAPTSVFQELAGSGYGASPPPDWREPAETVDAAEGHVPPQAPIETVYAPAPLAPPQEPIETVAAPAPPAPSQEPIETVAAPAPPAPPQTPIETPAAPVPPVQLQAPIETSAAPVAPSVPHVPVETADAPAPFAELQEPAEPAEPAEPVGSLAPSPVARQEPVETVAAPDRPQKRNDSPLIWAGAGIVLVATCSLIFFVVYPSQKNAPPSPSSTKTSAEQAPTHVQDEADQAVAARASQHEQLRQYDEAYADYSVLIAHQPQSRQWYLKRAQVTATAGNLKLAKQDVDAAIAMDDKQADAHVLSGDLNVQRNLFKDAVVDYSTALKLQPGDASIEQKIAAAKLKLEKMPQAQVTTPPAPFQWTPPKELVAKHPLNVAYQLMQDGQSAAAVPILADVIKKEPNNLVARRYLAWSASDSQMPKTATEQFKVLDKLTSLNAQDLAKFAACLQQVDATSAPAMFERAVRADPQNVDLREGLCRAYLGVKDYAKVLAAAQAGIRFAKDDNQRQSFDEMIKTSQQKELVAPSALR